MLYRRPLSALFSSQLCRQFSATAENKKHTSSGTGDSSGQRDVVLGEIDKIFPELHKNPKADFLRDADFETQVKPVIESLQETGLSANSLAELASKQPKALLMQKEREAHTNALELLRYLRDVRGIRDTEQLVRLVSRSAFLYNMPLKRIAAQIDLLKHQLDLSEVRLV